MKHILAATDFSTRSQRAVRRAAMFARQIGAELTLLHVIDEEPEHLVALECAESRNILDEQIASIAKLHGIRCHPAVEVGAAHEAIMRMADAAAVDLIVMGSHRRQLLRDIFVGTTIERVIRWGTWPVLMVNTDATRPYGSVLAALDLSDVSADAVRTARALGFLDKVRLTAAHAFDAIAKSKMGLADIPRDLIRAYIDDERQRSTLELQGFMRSLSFDVGTWSHYVAEGGAVPVISEAVRVVNPDLLVVGTHGRSGVAKLLLGSVAEQVLRALEVDILAVPRGTIAG